MTLAAVAESAGLSLPYVSNLERGRGNPTLEALQAIARALDMPLSELVADREDTRRSSRTISSLRDFLRWVSETASAGDDSPVMVEVRDHRRGENAVHGVESASLTISDTGGAYITIHAREVR
jgi:transcriptional regulator with XRE-family HTH domain